MTVEILFQEVCGLYGDSQNATYLEATLPDAQFIYTKLADVPYFVDHTPDLVYIGCMSEATQRRVIQTLIPYKDRICELIDNGTPILATGNAGEIFAKSISSCRTYNFRDDACRRSESSLRGFHCCECNDIQQQECKSNPSSS